jgi:hypothetical protein
MPIQGPVPVPIDTDSSRFDVKFSWSASKKDRHIARVRLTVFSKSEPGRPESAVEDTVRSLGFVELADRRTIENQRFKERRRPIDNGVPIIKKTIGNPLFFLRYFPPTPSRISHSPHSHSVLIGAAHELVNHSPITVVEEMIAASM